MLSPAGWISSRTRAPVLGTPSSWRSQLAATICPTSWTRRASSARITSCGAQTSVPRRRCTARLPSAAKIQAHLLDNGTVPTCEVIADPRDPGIQGLLHRVGEATVARLYAKVLEPNGRRAAADRAGLPDPRGVRRRDLHGHRRSRSGWPRQPYPQAEPDTGSAGPGSRARPGGSREAAVTPAGPAPAGSFGRARQRLVRARWSTHRARAHAPRLAAIRGGDAAAVGEVLEVLFAENLGRLYAASRIEAVDPMRSFVFTPYRRAASSRNWMSWPRLYGEMTAARSEMRPICWSGASGPSSLSTGCRAG